jgi:hypothetical protein
MNFNSGFSYGMGYISSSVGTEIKILLAKLLYTTFKTKFHQNPFHGFDYERWGEVDGCDFTFLYSVYYRQIHGQASIT